MYLITNLLLSNGGFVAAHGSHGFELRLFLDGPLGQLPQRQEQGVPVIRIVFKSISVKKNNKTIDYYMDFIKYMIMSNSKHCQTTSKFGLQISLSKV